MAQNVVSSFNGGYFENGPKTGGPSQLFFLMASIDF